MAKKTRQKRSRTPAGDTLPPEPDLRRAVSLVKRMMAIPGKSGQEGRVARLVTRLLRDAGAPASAIQTDSAHRRTPILGDTGNLVLRLPGTMRGPRRLLMAHLDTVPICVGSQPVLQDGFFRSADPHTGLGADDRAGAAVVLTAAREILKHRLPHPPLTFFWTVQEETGLQGVRLARLGLLGKVKLAFNFDGGAADKLTVGATGGYRLQIEVTGLASHAGAAPEMGVSAIAVASLAIADLVRGGWHGEIRKGRQHGTSNVGYIHGGEATNVVTDRVTVRAEARSHDATFRRRIVSEIEKAFQRAARQVKSIAGQSGQVKLDGRLDYESFRLANEEPCVLKAEAAVRSVGRQPLRSVANGGVDANWMVVHGIPTVTIGCGQINQHTVSEALDVEGYRDACRIALRLATASSEEI